MKPAAPRCADCRHCRVLTTDVIERLPTRCASPKTDQAMPFTDYIRGDNWLVSRVTGTCGREGRFFQPRYKAQPHQTSRKGSGLRWMVGSLAVLLLLIIQTVWTEIAPLFRIF